MRREIGGMMAGGAVMMGLAGNLSAAPYTEQVKEPREADPRAFGSIHGQLQSITMYRDYSELGRGDGGSSSLGIELSYQSPECGRLSGGLTYDAAVEIWRKNHSEINCNEGFHLLNEAWLKYQSEGPMTLKFGRHAINGEVFRRDAFRHKARAVEALQVGYQGSSDWHVEAGHAIRMSNWIQDTDRAEFNDFGDVFGAGKDTGGVTWLEGSIGDDGPLEVALYDAYAHDVANLVGTRIRWQSTSKRAWLGFYRHEDSLGDLDAGSDAFGVAIEQGFGDLVIELGSFSVRGDKLRFQETTTGLNHALGALMLICDSPYDGGADTGYLKAVYKGERTVYYGLYSYTHHQRLPYNGHELNLVTKHALTEHLDITLKLGVGLRQPSFGDSQLLTDSRLFVNYHF